MLKSTGVAANLSLSNLSNISNLSASDLKLAKSIFSANFDISMPITLFMSVLWHNSKNLIQLLFCFYYDFMVLEDNSYLLTHK